VLVLVVGAVQRLDERIPQSPGVATPVTLVWAQQARQFAYEWSGAGLRELGPAPNLDSNLAHVRGADVFLIFVESYGAVSWERAAYAANLAATRTQLAGDIAASGRQVVSAFVESPTFGGESWLAHISLMSGTEVRDGAMNARLMAQQRNTMTAPFRRQGYRSVAVMPGIQSVWPEGAFYGFDAIYGAPDLNYEGPPFGWWDVTDQFCLARVDALEVAPAPAARAPVFVMFPTISTHTPFTPTPPYQPDWARMLTPTPYDPLPLEQAYDGPADWLDLGPGYVRSLNYANTTLGGYLRLRADRDFVMIVIGDHQPPALVSGEGAPWDVPVHIITNRQVVLDRLVQRGFTSGLAPRRPALGKMHALTPLLLDAFGDGQ
jgi:Sulfatase